MGKMYKQLSLEERTMIMLMQREGSGLGETAAAGLGLLDRGSVSDDHRFMPDEPQYHLMASISPPLLLKDGFTLAKAALRGLDAVYKPESGTKKPA